jgi:sulfate/thiosulfate transport system ATP-binding protein
MSIEVENIRKNFGAYEALRGVSLTVNEGELFALLGPSGSGKTSLLRIIAGLETPDSGVVRLSGEDASSSSVRERQVGFVFQHYALFRHMTVFENIAFGLRVRPRQTRPPENEIRERVGKLLELIQLTPLGNRFPSQLSGGQRQRVALARALAVEPKVLLLDEPFGALDSKVRKELRRWLRRLHDELHVASVFVTHDQEEALEVADRVAIMNHGQIEQMGTPAAVYDKPANTFVYEFLGDVTIFNGHHLRPHDLDILPHSGRNTGTVLATVRFIGAAGAVVRVELRREDTGEAVEAEISREHYLALELQVGDHVDIAPRHTRVFAV